MSKVMLQGGRSSRVARSAAQREERRQQKLDAIAKSAKKKARKRASIRRAKPGLVVRQARAWLGEDCFNEVRSAIKAGILDADLTDLLVVHFQRVKRRSSGRKNSGERGVARYLNVISLLQLATPGVIQAAKEEIDSQSKLLPEVGSDVRGIERLMIRMKGEVNLSSYMRCLDLLTPEGLHWNRLVGHLAAGKSRRATSENLMVQTRLIAESIIKRLLSGASLRVSNAKKKVIERACKCETFVPATPWAHEMIFTLVDIERGLRQSPNSKLVQSPNLRERTYEQPAKRRQLKIRRPHTDAR